MPTAIVRFLESDSNSKVIAKPQLRGAEGTKLTLAVGNSIPVISTSYTPIATGGAGVNPLSSYQYKDVGVNIDMTPTVTLDGDIRLDMTLDNSQQGADTNVGGVVVPSFVQRTATTRLRLRDGESNLLAGLLQSRTTRKHVTGFPGVIHVPFLSDLFSHNTGENDQVDIVMLLTPHIVRTHEITIDDLKPIYIGSQQNLGIGGPQQLFAPQQPEAPPAGAGAAPARRGVPPGRRPARIDSHRKSAGSRARWHDAGRAAGSSPVPGTVVLPGADAAGSRPAAAQPRAGRRAGAGHRRTAPARTAPTPARRRRAAMPRPPRRRRRTGIGSAQVLISPPGTAFRVGGGPYTVPLVINDASRISTVTLTLIFDPTKLRVVSVQEGSFLRGNGVPVVFTQAVNGNRIDISLTRSADAIGATGTGLLAAILFDAIAPGGATLTLSGSATGPGGTAMGLRFTPVTITVQ